MFYGRLQMEHWSEVVSSFTAAQVMLNFTDAVVAIFLDKTLVVPHIFSSFFF